MKFLKYFCLSLLFSLALGILDLGFDKLSKHFGLDWDKDAHAKLSAAHPSIVKWVGLLLLGALLSWWVISWLIYRFGRKGRHEPEKAKREGHHEAAIKRSLAIKYVEEMSQRVERVTDIYSSTDGKFLLFGFFMSLLAWKECGEFFDEEAYELYPTLLRTDEPTVIYVFLVRDDNPANPLHLTPFHMVRICPYQYNTTAHHVLFFELTGSTRKRWKFWKGWEENLTEAEVPILTPVLAPIFGYQAERVQDQAIALFDRYANAFALPMLERGAGIIRGEDYAHSDAPFSFINEMDDLYSAFASQIPAELKPSRIEVSFPSFDATLPPLSIDLQKASRDEAAKVAISLGIVFVPFKVTRQLYLEWPD